MLKNQNHYDKLFIISCNSSSLSKTEVQENEQNKKWFWSILRAQVQIDKVK